MLVKRIQVLILSFKYSIRRQTCGLVFCAINIIIGLHLRLLQRNVIACWPRVGLGVEPCCEKDDTRTNDKLITLPLSTRSM